MTLRPCLHDNCGEPTTGTYCPEHHKADRHTDTATQRGYDHEHRRLSRKARQLQPFCADCLTTEGLQLDHGPETWERRAEGKRLRLQDYRGVVCGPCNRKRGRAR